MCSAHCEGTCDLPHPRCTRGCMNPGCKCKYGYVRDERTNKCIPLESCPREKQIFDELDEDEDDEEVGGFSVEAGYEKDGKYAKIKWEKDEMDEDWDPPVRRLRNPRRLYMKSYANCQRCRAYNGYSPACNQFC